MAWLEILRKQEMENIAGDGAADYIRNVLGIPVDRVVISHLYLISDDIPQAMLDGIGERLVDPITQDYRIVDDERLDAIVAGEKPATDLTAHVGPWEVVVGYKTNPLVLDSWGDHTRRALADIGFPARDVRKFEKYLVIGKLPFRKIRLIAEEKLSDGKVQDYLLLPATR
ncbi:hypothetical protein JXB02_05665 [Candidatus Woesearchaeota archaeon]|nr:hypothetical protein [Candidatus Woesearchaeota archaeon]